MTSATTSIWRFTRHQIYGFHNRNRVSTDALNALSNWRETDGRRSFRITQGEDDDDVVVVELSTHLSDINAGIELDQHCDKAGVVRQPN